MKKEPVPFNNAQFVASAFDVTQWPTLKTQNGQPMIEIAIVGRSNVGKSTLINHLFNNKKLAKTSAIPGKTQSINFFIIDDQIALVDLPGYGYAAVGRKTQRTWSESIDRYFHERPTLKIVLLLVDCRRDLSDDDIALLRWASLHQKPVLLIMTKADKLNQSQKQQSIAVASGCVGVVKWMHYSITNPRSRMELINNINALIKQYHGPN